VRANPPVAPCLPRIGIVHGARRAASRCRNQVAEPPRPNACDRDRDDDHEQRQRVNPTEGRREIERIKRDNVTR